MSVEITTPTYNMVTATLENDEIIFGANDFDEARRVGFFRIKTPNDLDIRIGREFAKTFTSNPRYMSVGEIDQVNGFLYSNINQTVRFTLERDHWNEPHKDGQPLYPIAMQELGHKMHALGIKILKSILVQYGLPQDLWFKATGGSSHSEGSHFLLTNCYDPKLGDKPYGVGPHKDWGHVTILDADAPGLQVKIDDLWHELYIEEGYLIVNFGYCLEKLLPGVNASLHRVVTQTTNMRTSTVAFIDPRVGPFRKDAQTEHDQGYVYDWDISQKSLINEKPVTEFFKELSEQLYGNKQS